MSLEVLVSTMEQQNYQLLDRMKIDCDVVVVNQCDEDSMATFVYRGHNVKWINMSQRGIGLSRNTALMNAKAELVLFADDDMVYNDGYAVNVIQSFEATPEADVICFNISLANSTKNIGGHRDNKNKKRLHVYNSMRYGATLIGARRKALLRERISFSLLFGGGAEFSSGEDTLFVKDCLEAHLKLYSDTYCLGVVDDSESSWFHGINDTFFIDRGMVYTLAFGKMSTMICLYYACRFSTLDKKYSARRIYQLFKIGKKEIRGYK